MLLMVLLAGCEPPAQPTAAAKLEPALIKRALTAEEIKKCLDAEDVALEPSQDRIISGDLRPRWIVSGRITSGYWNDLKSVKVLITAIDKTTFAVLDTAEFEVDDVPSESAKGFRREIPLMVRPGKFDFTYEFPSATTEYAK